jgi:hypothetical protein
MNEDLPACCASCGMRLLFNNDRYKRISLDNLEKLKYTELQRAAHLLKNDTTKSIASVNVDRRRRNNNSDVYHYYHLHPELVEVETRSCMPCGERCKKGIDDAECFTPPYSIAAGYDFGVLSRALPQNNLTLSLTEKLCLAKNRLYIQILKLK